VKACIAGPDINPALFMSLVVRDIQIGPNALVPTPEDKVLTTVLLSMAMVTVITGGLLIFVGYFLLARVVQYLPASLLSGFLGCIGYKVMKAALTTTCGDYYYDKPDTLMFWKLLMPALLVGLGIYTTKQFHIGSPSFTIPAFLLIPVCIFYMVLYIQGVSMEMARDPCIAESCQGGWFFPEFEKGSFYSVYEELDLRRVDAAALMYGFTNVPAMLVIVIIDYLLKLAGTKKALRVDFSFDHEMKVAGTSCLFSVLGVGPPAISQPKFTLLDYSITHSKTSSIPGVVCALFNGIIYFWGIPLINWIPKFILGGLLIYAGLGFMVDNLYFSRQRVSKEEFAAIWAIVITNAFAGLIYAVVVGVVLSAIIFVLTYSKLEIIKSFRRGADFESKVLRNPMESKKLRHLSKRFAIIQMQHFIFFGSASQLLDFTKNLVQSQQKMPQVQRLAYLACDWSQVDGIDYSGVGVFLEIVDLLKVHGTNVIFGGVAPSIVKSLLKEGVTEKFTGIHDSLDTAVEWVEEQFLEWAHLVRSRWMEFKPVIHMHEVTKNIAKHDVPKESLAHLGHQLWK